MRRSLLGGWCAAVLLTVCGCAAPSATTTTVSGAYAGQRYRPTGGLSLITEPGPGDAPFIALIDSARQSIDVTMYELTDQRVERALAATAARGVRVAVLLDDGQYGAGRPLNDAAYDYLAAHGVRGGLGAKVLRAHPREVDRHRRARSGDHDPEPDPRLLRQLT